MTSIALQNWLGLLGALLGSCLLGRAASAQSASQPAPTGPAFVTAIAFAQHFASPAALVPANDRRLKATLLHALNEKPPTISWGEVRELFDKEQFAQWAPHDRLTREQMVDLLSTTAPASRREIFRETAAHLELLTTQFDMIDKEHQQAANELARWIAKHAAGDKQLGVTIICTGNSRRSMLGSVLGNLAAAYWGLPRVKFYSGGTAPTAFNPRTIKTLEQLGVKITPTGADAAPGKGGERNPIYQVRWGEHAGVDEFSKLFADKQNPQRDFAAVLVCDEADAACPVVDGAALRISAPFFDPKAYDGTPLETAKYAERRDDMGRMLLSALMQARCQLEQK